jgi:O-antigen/teichoic acid export membrane protein
MSVVGTEPGFEGALPSINGIATAPALTFREVRTKASRGIKILLVRLGLLQVPTLIVGILLARILEQTPFGVFAIAVAIASMANIMGDLGLSAALLQRHEAIEEDQLRATFTVQALLGLGAGALALLAGPLAERLLWGTSDASSILLPVVLGMIVLPPLRAVPTMVLERELAFGRVTAIELGEHFTYCAVALGLAWQGWGVDSLGLAVLARSAVGLFLAVLLTPWRPRFTTRLAGVRPLLSFGIAHQSGTFVYMLNGLLAPLLVGRFAGASALGFVLWAIGNAERPKPLLEIISRVAFPSYARLRASAEIVQAGLERTVHGGLLATSLYAGLLGGVAPTFVALVYTPVWLPGVPFLYLFLVVSPLVVLTILLDVAFLARGEARTVRNLHGLRFLLSVAFALPATWHFGAAGFVIAHGVAMAGFCLAEILCARRFVRLGPVLRAACGPLSAGVAAAAVSRGTLLGLASLSPLLSLPLAVVAGGLAFALVEWFFDRERLRRSVGFLTRKD